MRASSITALLLLGLTGCESVPSTAQDIFGDLDLRRCQPGPGTTGSPQSIAEAVALANSLPQPATAACFLEALDRPLHVEASKSKASMQPADGARSPRLFIFSGDALIITAAVGGEGKDLIEFGETVSPGRTVKGEIEFPLRAALEEDAAYARIRNPEHDNITVCFVCHDSERDEPNFPGARSSLALRPRTKSLVPIESLSTELASCDWEAEKERCGMLQAVAAWGPLEHRAFEQGLPTF
ncbi:MAG: hypothetical protein ACRBN8_12555 [Nannocystales bacterium]